MAGVEDTHLTLEAIPFQVGGEQFFQYFAKTNKKNCQVFVSVESTILYLHIRFTRIVEVNFWVIIKYSCYYYRMTKPLHYGVN